MTLENDIESWIFNWVSQYNENLQAIPCPFAKQAFVDNKILIRELTPTTDLSMAEYFECELENYTAHWPHDKEVVALGCKPNLISADNLEEIVSKCNQTFLKNRGYIALEDHPMAVEIIAGETMNQGEWALVLVQLKSKLDKASHILDKQGYYKTWSEENLNEVVSWRNNY